MSWLRTGRPNRLWRRRQPMKSWTMRRDLLLSGRGVSQAERAALLTQTQSYWPQVEAVQRPHRHESRLIQLLQLHRK
jgi:hypothetical protein